MSLIAELEQEVQAVIAEKDERSFAVVAVFEFMNEVPIERLIDVMQENASLWDTHWPGTPINTPRGGIIQILLMRFETTLSWPAWASNMYHRELLKRGGG